MSRTVLVPDFGDSGSRDQYVEVAEPGEPGYPTPALPEGDPWAPAVNQARAEVEAARPDAYLANVPYADLEPEAGPVPYTLPSRAEAVLASWDRFRALERAERVALGEPEPEPEAEL